MTKHTVKVWDPLIRIGHWTLVVAFFAAYFSEDDLKSLHIWAGYVVGGYVLVRLVWGFIGSRYARFSQFLYSPARVIRYLQGLLAGKAQHYVGHNPAGGVMVVALLLCLSATAITGLKLYAIEDNQGPFAVEQSSARNQLPQPVDVSRANDPEDHDEDVDDQEGEKPGEALWEELHEIFANLTLLLVILHIAGIAASSWVDREKLVKAMLTGKKDIDDTYQ